MKDDRVRIISRKLFQEMYEVLSGRHCAFKEDCVEYCVWRGEDEYWSYPEWLMTAMDDTRIVDIYGSTYLYTETGEVCISYGDIIIVNHLFDLHYLQPESFHEIYETYEHIINNGGQVNE